jgi:hypothetical protein
MEIGNAYKECFSVEELSAKFAIQPKTIISHLTTYVREGNKINTDLLIDLIETNEEKQKEVFEAFEKLGVNYLRPVFDELKETVPYDNLHILRIIYLNKTIK